MADRGRKRSRWAPVVAIAVAAAVLALLLWFPFTARPPGTELTGRVTAGGKPVAFGTVTAVAADGRVVSTPILPDGTYVLRDVPAGPLRLAVSSPNPRSIEERVAEADRDGRAADGAGPNDRAGRSPVGGVTRQSAPGISIAAPEGPTPAAPAGTGGLESTSRPPQQSQWFPIPGRYASPSTSGLVGAVRGEKNSLDLKLDGIGARSAPAP